MSNTMPQPNCLSCPLCRGSAFSRMRKYTNWSSCPQYAAGVLASPTTSRPPFWPSVIGSPSPTPAWVSGSHVTAAKSDARALDAAASAKPKLATVAMRDHRNRGSAGLRRRKQAENQRRTEDDDRAKGTSDRLGNGAERQDATERRRPCRQCDPLSAYHTLPTQ